MLYVLSLRKLGLLLFCAFSVSLMPSFSVAVAPPASEMKSASLFMSYREWKNSKVNECELKLKKIKDKSALTALSIDPNLQMKEGRTLEAGLNREIREQMEREMDNLSLAKDLTISDYFVGYLTKQSSLDRAILEVSQRLSPEEVAELMAAYAQNFSIGHSTSLKVAPRADSGL